MRIDIIIKNIKTKLKEIVNSKEKRRALQNYKIKIKNKIHKKEDIEEVKEILREVEMEMSSLDANNLIEALNLNYYGIYKIERRFTVR